MSNWKELFDQNKDYGKRYTIKEIVEAQLLFWNEYQKERVDLDTIEYLLNSARNELLPNAEIISIDEESSIHTTSGKLTYQGNTHGTYSTATANVEYGLALVDNSLIVKVYATPYFGTSQIMPINNQNSAVQYWAKGPYASGVLYGEPKHFISLSTEFNSEKAKEIIVQNIAGYLNAQDQ